MSASQVIEITANEAWDMINKTPGTLLVDVRSHMEFLFIGHPTGAINVPWIDEPDWNINPRFASEIRQLMLGGLPHEGGKAGVAVILICRSGKRSLEAGHLLISENFTNVYSIEDGFEGELNDQHHRSSIGGWRFAGLPWEQC